jgi:hypothetical protein
MARSAKHRTTVERLNDLSADNMYLSLGRSRADVLGRISLGNIGLAASRILAARGGGNREAAVAACAVEAAARLGLERLDALAPGERIAWDRWAPIVLALDGVEGWTAEERRAAADVVRAKGGRRESDFVLRFDAHARLRQAVHALSRRAR